MTYIYGARVSDTGDAYMDDPAGDREIDLPTEQQILDWQIHEDHAGDLESDGMYDPEPYEDDVWADSQTFISAGWGTEEDYGYYGDDDF